jgi:hypothetical protein
MKVTFKTIHADNIDNKIQLTVLQGDVGDILQRHNVSEQLHFDTIKYHPDNNKIQEETSYYFFVQGKIETYYEWEDGEIESSDVDFLLDLVSDYEGLPEAAVVEKSSNKLTIQIEYKKSVTKWTNRAFPYSLSTNIAGFKSLEKDSVMICMITEDDDWTYKNVDIDPEQSIVTNKLGEDCYIIVSDSAAITVEENIIHLGKYETVKLESDVAIIKNSSDKIQRILMVHR